MPHIKYFGGEPPAAVSDLVEYADPDASCYEGRWETRVSSDSECEKRGLPREVWGAKYVARITTSPYRGMQHVGGVGIVDDAFQLRPFDRVIGSEEFAGLKQSIVAANETFKKNSQARLARDNDTSRRGEPESESLGWRTRIWVSSHVELTHHVRYRVHDSCHAYPRVRIYLPTGETVHLVDLYHRCDGDIRQAMFHGIDAGERLADLLALSGFGAASVLEVVGTSPPVCRQGEAFDVATLQVRVVNTPIAVAPEVFQNAHVDGVGHLALRNLRHGLAAKLPTASLVAFWNALECQADADARAHARRRRAHCKACGAERDVGWDLKTGFEEMYADAGVAAQSHFDRHRSLRGRIQHGEVSFGDASPSEVFPEVTRLQSAAIVATGKRIGMPPQTGIHLLGGVPIAIFECVVQEGTYKVSVRSSDIGVVPSILPMRASDNRHRVLRAGLELPPTVNPLVLPPLDPPMQVPLGLHRERDSQRIATSGASGATIQIDFRSSFGGPAKPDS